MTSNLTAVCILSIIFGSIVIIIKASIQGKVLSKMIEHNHLSKDTELPDLKKFGFDKLVWLKWGIVILFLSIGLIIKSIYFYDMSDEVFMGFIGIFIGTGFILSYFVDKKINEE